MTDIADLLDSADALTIGGAVTVGDLDPVELTQAAIDRIEERNPALNAIIATRFDEALDEAKAVDRTAPFAGVPFVVKDCRARVKGMTEGWGSRLFRDNVADADSELTRRYRAAGLIILGVSNMPELGKMATTEPLAHGATRNPYAANRSVGGSSGGTGAAVAAGMVPIGHGNDGGGSIRIPASACGLFGLKPSRGRITAHPSPALLAYPTAVDHVLTRSVRDSARMLDLTAGPMRGDPYEIPQPAESWLESTERDPGALRIGVAPSSMDGPAFEPACAAALGRAVTALTTLGHQVEEAAFPVGPGSIARIGAIMTAAGRTMIDDRLAELGRELREDDIEPFTRYLYDLGGAFSSTDVVRGLQTLELLGRDAGSYFERFDLFLSPTLPTAVPELGEYDTSNVDELLPIAGRLTGETAIFNASGQPAASVPMGTDDAGVPVGVQLAAAFGREDLVLAVSRQLETAAPWPTACVWPPEASS
ncbi:MAG: amidase [Acidimicrobiia bacterium]